MTSPYTFLEIENSEQINNFKKTIKRMENIIYSIQKNMIKDSNIEDIKDIESSIHYIYGNIIDSLTIEELNQFTIFDNCNNNNL